MAASKTLGFLPVAYSSLDSFGFFHALRRPHGSSYHDPLGVAGVGCMLSVNVAVFLMSLLALTLMIGPSRFPEFGRCRRGTITRVTGLRPSGCVKTKPKLPLWPPLLLAEPHCAASCLKLCNLTLSCLVHVAWLASVACSLVNMPALMLVLRPYLLCLLALAF